MLDEVISNVYLVNKGDSPFRGLLMQSTSLGKVGTIW